MHTQSYIITYTNNKLKLKIDYGICFMECFLTKMSEGLTNAVSVETIL